MKTGALAAILDYEQQSPNFLAPGIGFVEENFSTDWGRGWDGSGGNARDGELQVKLCLLAHRSPPVVWPSSQ